MADGSLLHDYEILSTQTKPIGKKGGVTLIETDTGNEFIWSGKSGAWYQMGLNGKTFNYLPDTQAGEDFDRGNKGATRVEFNNKPFSVTRTTADASVGTVGAVGDFLHRVIVTGVIGAADLTISDGEGTVVCVVPGGTAAGAFNQELNVEAKGGGFVVDLHATDVGTVTCFGDFS